MMKKYYFTVTVKFQKLSLGLYMHNIFWFYSPQKLSLNSIAQLLANEINFKKPRKRREILNLLLRKEKRFSIY